MSSKGGVVSPEPRTGRCKESLGFVGIVSFRRGRQLLSPEFADGDGGRRSDAGPGTAVDMGKMAR